MSHICWLRTNPEALLRRRVACCRRGVKIPISDSGCIYPNEESWVPLALNAVPIWQWHRNLCYALWPWSFVKPRGPSHSCAPWISNYNPTFAHNLPTRSGQGKDRTRTRAMTTSLCCFAVRPWQQAHRPGKSETADKDDEGGDQELCC